MTNDVCSLAKPAQNLPMLLDQQKLTLKLNKRKINEALKMESHQKKNGKT